MRKIQPDTNSDICQCKRCRQIAEVYYFGYAICEKHWEKHCEGKINLKKIFQISESE